MKITIGAYDADKRSVPVVFAHAGITHSRDVNACFDSKAKYDAKATAARVDEVALGVAAKIEAGAITIPPEPAAA